MKIKVGGPKDVENLVQWLSDHVAPGGLYKTWLAEANGQDLYISNDHNSWKLTYFYMLGHTVELIGLDKDVIVELRLSLDLEGGK